MKRLISILVLVAMMLTTFAGTLTALADEVAGDDTVVEGDGTTEEGGETEVEAENVFNVNWKELVESGTMRSQWCYDRGSWQNNMPSKYNITATENALTLTAKGGGDHRQYYSDVMFDLTADTNYVYELEVDSKSYGDGGFIFAFGSNPLARDEDDDKIDINGNGTTEKVAAYFLRGNLNTGNAHLKFGGAWDNYGYQDKKNISEGVKDAKVVDGYTKYKVVYTGLTVEFFYLNTSDEWVELYANETITLVEGTKLAVGVYTWSPDWANIKNCVVTATNEAALTAMKAALVPDNTALEAKLAEAKTFAEADWFVEDWAAFAKVLPAAEAQLTFNKYQILADKQVAALTDAIAKLVAKRANIKITLEAKIAEITTLAETKDLYTETSWNRVAEALAVAEAAIADEATEQATFVAAYYAIVAAQKGLLTKELAAKNVYNVNWKLLYENNMLRSQWWWENTDNQNNYLELYNQDCIQG